MLLVEAVGGLLILVGIVMLFVSLVGQADVNLPGGISLKLPPSVLVLIIGVAVFLFPYSPWWPTPAPSPSPSPTATVANTTPISTLTPTPSIVSSPTAPARTSVSIDFETPSLGGASRQVINPLVSDGVTFTTEGGVVGLVRNNATSACVEPADANQKLGTGTSGDSIGLSAFPIRAQFSQVLRPGSTGVRVSAQFQTLAGATVRIRLLDATGALVNEESVPAGPADGTCGFPGNPRARVVVTAQASSAVAAALLVGQSGTVFVVDEFAYEAADQG